jgi:hemin uptake protein HemP
MGEPTIQPQRPTPPALSETPARLSSEVLFGAQREVVIVHNGREYHLRLTQNDKMILTA